MDSDGRPVELTEERWSHIVERHPEIEGYEADVLSSVQSPDFRMTGRLANERWFYAAGRGPSRWLKVVVAYGGERGYIVTVYARSSMP